MATSARQAQLEKVAAIAERIGASEAVEIVDVELLGSGSRRVLRVSIDKPGGVTHSDCERVSDLVGAALDAEDVIPGGQYTLEVSSPGVERRLKKPRDFERFSGQKARISLREPVEGRRNWEGRLAGYAEGRVTLETSDGKTIAFPLDQVDRANLKYDW